ncbi:MAG: methionine--tRNA ligase subunit beta, partial [Planctomycetales bacterium]|nr:methionine--tRNA ligase subunit beta [Planctomycetales bacterium]
VDDLDLNLDELVAKVNADLVGKVVNLASRTAKFVTASGLSAVYPDDGGLFRHAAAVGDEIAEAYEHCDYNRAMRLIMELADRANPYVESAEPWKLAKDPAQAARLQDVCTVALNLFRQLAIYLAPVLPRLARQTGELLGQKIENWEQSQTPLVACGVHPFQHMLKRVEPQQVQAMIEESKHTAAPGGAATFDDSGEALVAEPLAEQISFDDFTKVDLRIARVVDAESVPEARKLLKLTLSLGGDERRTVLAGIKAAYAPEALIGRLVVYAANLAPRQMKFGVSEGMVIASGPGGKEVYLLSPDEGAVPGQRVH